MKKLPLVFSGCLLGLAGAGNLILDTLPVLSHLLSLTGLVLWIYFLILHLFNWKETKQELTKNCNLMPRRRKDYGIFFRRIFELVRPAC